MIDTGRIILCTETEILHLDSNGEYINSVPIPTISQNGIQMPEINKIQSITAFSRGFVIGGENGVILAYEKVDDPTIHYRICCKKIEIKLDLGNNTT